MLYDGALRFMDAGRKAMVSGDLSLQNTSLQKAQKIIFELMSCIDMKEGGEIARNLLGIYTYVVNELVEANIKDHPDSVERCMKIMSDLRESWVQLENNRTKDEEAA